MNGPLTIGKIVNGFCIVAKAIPGGCYAVIPDDCMRRYRTSPVGTMGWGCLIAKFGLLCRRRKHIAKLELLDIIAGLSKSLAQAALWLLLVALSGPESN